MDLLGLISLSAVHIASELASGATAQSILISVNGLATFIALWITFDCLGQITTVYLTMSILGAIIIIQSSFSIKSFPENQAKRHPPFEQIKSKTQFIFK